MYKFIRNIKIRRAYFRERHVDIVWYGEKRIKRRITRDCGSFYYIGFSS
jgi:hypothetical protein